MPGLIKPSGKTGSLVPEGHAGEDMLRSRRCRQRRWQSLHGIIVCLIQRLPSGLRRAPRHTICVYGNQLPRGNELLRRTGYVLGVVNGAEPDGDGQ